MVIKPENEKAASDKYISTFKQKDAILVKEAVMKQKTNHDLNTLKRNIQLDFWDIFYRKMKPFTN